MKKVFLIVPTLHFGGAEKIIITLCDMLDYRKYEITLVVINKVGAKAEYENHNINIVDLKTPRIKNAFFKIISLLKNEQPDLVISTLNHLNFMMSIIALGFPRIVFIGRQTRELSTSIGNTKVIRWITLKLSFLLNNMNGIIAQSNGMEKDLFENSLVKKDKVYVINNGVDFDKIASLKDEECIFFNKQKINIIAVGRLAKSKGYERMLQVFSLLDKNNFNLTILGEGSMKNELLDLSEKLGISEHVCFKGYASNPYKYVKNADIFLITSYSEGFSNAVVEALACGTYVYGFPFNGDEIIQNGINGEIEKSNDINKLADLINKKHYQRNSKSEIVKTVISFSVRNMIDRYEFLFNKMLTK